MSGNVFCNGNRVSDASGPVALFLPDYSYQWLKEYAPFLTHHQPEESETKEGTYNNVPFQCGV